MAIIEIHLKNDQLYKVEGQNAIVYVHDHDIGEIRYTNSSDQLSFDVGGTTNAIIVGPAGITTFSTTPSDDKGDLRSVPRNSKSSAYVLIASDAGKCITITTGGVTINPSVMS